MAAIYNLEFTRVDTELSIYINGRLRATKFVDPHLTINSKYQFYVESGQPVHLTIVLYSISSENAPSKPWDQARVAFTLYRTGAKRPLAMVHDNWVEKDGKHVNVKEYTYLLK